ncbi:hypothetical protein DYQ86_15615 [Acidobacteria bacterium AB60]|nr:hypothetical protein DYQ86_15615 [Acidobacteria bacterium AB60]
MSTIPDKWETIKMLFEQAREVPAASRQAFLLRRCDDPAVRVEVERLLAEFEEAGNFLSKPLVENLQLYRAPQIATHKLAEGELLSGRFLIVNFVAAGGMGEVYRAQDVILDRTVALKSLSPELALDPTSFARLRAEAMAASALSHPNICTVYDFGEDNGRPYIIMEYLEGSTLAERLRSGPCTVAETIHIGFAVSSALSAAHRKGIIHRDLKPGNIILTSTGPKLLDFGLAHKKTPVPIDQEQTQEPPGEDLVAGTLPYMSPECLRGQGTDARGDIFSFGAVVYEMLTGKAAFKRDSKMGTIEAIFRADPLPLRRSTEKVPDELEDIVRGCLRKELGERCASMAEIEGQFRKILHTTRLSPKLILETLQKPGNRLLVLVTLTLLIAFGVWWLHRESRVRWARNQALPQIQRLAEEEKFSTAYALAVQAERFIPHDPTLAKMWDQISWTDDITTSPPGAAVYRKDYDSADSSWELIGRSPILKHRFQLVDSSWKFELEGYQTAERTTAAGRTWLPTNSMKVAMVKRTDAPDGMVQVELGESRPVSLMGMPGYDSLPPVRLGTFWIDKFEVTNADYKRFLDQRGYERKEYWKQEFRKDGRALSWTEAMKLFVDATGKPGPSQWIGGEYPRGQDNYPVEGVSWFEAAAYAEFVGKSLPTIYHWRVAAQPIDSSSIIPNSNFGKVGSAPVGAYKGASWVGAYDMAGNVKEWIWNQGPAGMRYILGGAWNEPTHAFNDPDARSPFERSATFGFRCGKYMLAGESIKAADPIMFMARDYSREQPASDQTFDAYKVLYSYDKTPLNAKVESVELTEDWRKEKVTFDAAYGGERVIAYLFLPRNASPPFETVIEFTGAGAFVQRSSSNLEGYIEDFDFIVKSGRAVMFPVYKGMFERGNNYLGHGFNTNFYRDEAIAWSKDLGRSIDYLQTRTDIDHNKLAYLGSSMGAALGAVLPAIESRLKVLVLVCPGFWLQKRFPAADQINFAPHVKAPVLMLNGRYDFVFPPEISQEPMFRLLGARNDQKRRVVFDSGHDIPRAGEIKETTLWLDKHLGSVNRR